MKRLRALTLSLAACATTLTAAAQDTTAAQPKVKVNIGADLVSSYVSRGACESGAAIQPGIGVGIGGFNLSMWGSADYKAEVAEFDWVASYTTGGLTVGLTEYWGPHSREDDGSFPKYGNWDNHMLEANLQYDFGEKCKKFALTVEADVNLVNDKDDDNKEQYSTYVELGYPLNVGSVGLDLAVGLTPFKGSYSDKLNVVNLSVKGTKELKITDKFSLPVFVQGVVNPYTEQAYVVCGVCLWGN